MGWYGPNSKRGDVPLKNWPGNFGARKSRKHCPTCGECRPGRCWKKSEEHVVCARHADSQPAGGARTTNPKVGRT